MAPKWEEFTFAELIKGGALEIGDGYRAKLSELGGDGPIFLRAGHVRDTHIDFSGVDRFDRRLAEAVAPKMSRPGDVVVTTKGNSTGRVTFVEPNMPPFVYSPHLSYWRSLEIERIVPGFLRYWSRSNYFRDQLAGLAGSTDMAPYLSLVDQRRLRIPLPSPNEQHCIAITLGALDDKIALNRLMSETLDEIVRAIFKSWFVDTEFSTDWRTANLSDVCEYILSGGTPNTKITTYWDGDVPWLSSGETRNRFICRTDRKITQAGVENSSTRFVRRGCTVIASAGQGHTRGQTSLMMIDSYVNQSVIALAADARVVSDLYLFFDLGRRYDEFRQISDSQSSRGSLTTKLLGELRLVVPPRDLVVKFDQTVRPLVNRIGLSVEEGYALTSLRDTLLPKLVSGEIRVAPNLHIGSTGSGKD